MDRFAAMADRTSDEAISAGRNVRLDTLVRLRWFAVIGQTTAVLVVFFGLDFELPIWACLAVIALAAAVYWFGGRAKPIDSLAVVPFVNVGGERFECADVTKKLAEGDLQIKFAMQRLGGLGEEQRVET